MFAVLGGTVDAKAYDLDIKGATKSTVLSISLDEMPNRSIASNDDTLEITLSLDKKDKNYQEYVAAKSTGIITINGEKNDFSAEGTLTLYENNVVLGGLVGSINNSSDLNDVITLSVHYDIETGDMSIPVSIGVLSKNTESTNYKFGSSSIQIQKAVQMKLEQDKNKTQDLFVTPPSEDVIASLPPGDYMSSLRNQDDHGGAWLGLYAPKAVRRANNGVHDVGVSTRVNKNTFENYMRGKGYSIYTGAAGCNGPIKPSISLDNSTSGLGFITNAFWPINSSTSITLPIPTTSNPATWGTISIPTASTSCTQTVSSTSWNMSRLAGFTSQIYSSNGMGAKAEIAHRSNPNATSGKITGAVSYTLYATTNDYIMVYETIYLSTSVNVIID
ncbi:MAG: hypothetical protein GX923_02045 [Clostridia bacterium]|nr:hypothetical protein [Clostridia bacterium]